MEKDDNRNITLGIIRHSFMSSVGVWTSEIFPHVIFTSCLWENPCNFLKILYSFAKRGARLVEVLPDLRIEEGPLKKTGSGKLRCEEGRERARGVRRALSCSAGWRRARFIYAEKTAVSGWRPAVPPSREGTSRIRRVEEGEEISTVCTHCTKVPLLLS